MIGSLGSVASANSTASYKQEQISTIETWNTNQDIISNLCITLAPLLNPKAQSCLPQMLIFSSCKGCTLLCGVLIVAPALRVPKFGKLWRPI